ncbi:MAG: histidine phosphatase family protein [Gemmatimonadaceae bacterium]
MISLLVVRHAIAVDADVYARDHNDDDLRPLTKDGRERMDRAARGLARIAPPIVTLASSSLVRAVQTADILAPHFAPAERVQTDALAPGEKPAKLLQWLRARRPSGAVAIVGHESHLGSLVSWLLASSDTPFVELKKGGACLVEFPGDLRAGSAMLRWVLTPAQLRRLGA